uniref:Uncharacterized protein n=1 Tax=Arundo donax TaxID=35708 RepID=A0A0A9E3Z9_ARUDO
MPGRIRLRFPGPQQSLQLVHGAGQRLQPSRVRQRPRHDAGRSGCLNRRNCRLLLRAIRFRARNLGALRGLRRRDLVPRSHRRLRGRQRRRRRAVLPLLLPRRALRRRAPPRLDHLGPLAPADDARGEHAREREREKRERIKVGMGEMATGHDFTSASGQGQATLS